MNDLQLQNTLQHYDHARQLRAEATRSALRSVGGWLSGRVMR